MRSSFQPSCPHVTMTGVGRRRQQQPAELFSEGLQLRYVARERRCACPQVAVCDRLAFPASPRRSGALIYLVVVAVLFLVALFLIRSARIRPADAWHGIADVGPASSPAAWQAARPPVLLVSYAAWPGVFAAASAQGPVLGLPGAASSAGAQRLVDLIARTPSLRALVVHGIPWGSLELARLLRAQVPSVRILFVYHGSPSAPFHAAESRLVADLIDAENAGVVDAIGAVKAGFAETLERFGARNTFTVPNMPSVAAVLPTGKFSAADNRVHIGVFASNDALHKNVATQLVAACSVRGAVVHATFLPAIAYLRGCDIVITGFLEHDRFLAELSRMDVLSYVTLTECYPMLVLEAAAAGVPVVVSRTHRIFDNEPTLFEALVVFEADSPSAIAAKISGAAAVSEVLRPLLLRLTSSLRREAELAWGQVLGLTRDEARRVQLAAFADSDAGTAVDSAEHGERFSEEPFISELDSAPPRIRVAFLTYELAPVMPGGAGVVLTSLIEDLLSAGHSVTVLAYMSITAMDEWSRIMEAKGWAVGAGLQLIVHHVPTLSRESELDKLTCGPRNIFLRRSWLFALAAQAAYLLEPFDAIEAFDYVGAGFELTRRLSEWRRDRARRGRGESGGGDEAALAAAPPYVPEQVPILVRLHGSLQLIHQQEGIFVGEAQAVTPRPCRLSDSEREGWPLMYLMEQYALRAAHVLLPQSLALQTLYAQAYGVGASLMLLAPPPMTRVTAHLRTSARGTPALAPGSELHLLVYGRVMRVKGAETVAAAADAIRAALPPGISLHLSFAGLDWDCPLHKRPTSQCVREILPRGLRATFLGQLGPDELSKLLPHVHGAVFASEFETFGMAAHELAAARLPLVVSDIAAFSEFFGEHNAYVFRSGEPVALASAVSALVSDLRRDSPRIARLSYANAVTPYERVAFAVRQRGGFGAPTSDLMLLEAAIARKEEECWPTSTREACVL